jgi:FkbM family methyltransferase
VQLAGAQATTIFDVGAHEGQTAKLLRKLAPTANIYCFEPDPRSYRILEARLEADQRAMIQSSAIADAPGEVEFFLNEFSATSSILPRPSSGRRYYPTWAAATSRTRVPSTTLDAFCHENGIRTIDVLKMDIQGGELAALRGATRLLRDRRISVLHNEVYFVPHYEHSPMLWDQARHLGEFGYTIFGLYNIASGENGQIRFGDAIFVSPEIRSAVVDRAPAEP